MDALRSLTGRLMKMVLFITASFVSSDGGLGALAERGRFCLKTI
jgi:hypothetical protein